MWLPTFSLVCFSIVMVSCTAEHAFEAFEVPTINCSPGEVVLINGAMATLQSDLERVLSHEYHIHSDPHHSPNRDGEPTKMCPLSSNTHKLREKYLGITTATEDARITEIFEGLKLLLAEVTVNCPKPGSGDLRRCKRFDAVVIASTRPRMISACPKFWEEWTTMTRTHLGEGSLEHVHRVEVHIINEMLRIRELAEVLLWEPSVQPILAPYPGWYASNYALYISAVGEAGQGVPGSPHPDVMRAPHRDVPRTREL